jgi:hypothetical protein
VRCNNFLPNSYINLLPLDGRLHPHSYPTPKFHSSKHPPPLFSSVVGGFWAFCQKWEEVEKNKKGGEKKDDEISLVCRQLFAWSHPVAGVGGEPDTKSRLGFSYFSL